MLRLLREIGVTIDRRDTTKTKLTYEETYPSACNLHDRSQALALAEAMGAKLEPGGYLKLGRGQVIEGEVSVPKLADSQRWSRRRQQE